MFKFAQNFTKDYQQQLNSNLQILGKKLKETHESPIIGKKPTINTQTNPYSLTSGAFTNQTSSKGFNNAVSDASLPRTSVGGYGKLLEDIGRAALEMGYVAAPYASFGSKFSSNIAQGALSFAVNGGDPLNTAFGMVKFPKFGKSFKREPLEGLKKRMSYNTKPTLSKEEFKDIVKGSYSEKIMPKYKYTNAKPGYTSTKSKPEYTNSNTEYTNPKPTPEDFTYTPEGYKVPDSYGTGSRPVKQGNKKLYGKEFDKFMLNRGLSVGLKEVLNNNSSN